MESVLDMLKAKQNTANKLFCEKIIPTNLEILGVSIPAQRQIAKEISKQDWRQFFDTEKEGYEEIVTLKGLVLGYAKMDIDLFLQYLEKFYQKVCSWSNVDVSASSFKIIAKNRERVLPIILKYLNDKNEFKQRLSIVLLLDYFVTDEYIDLVIEQTKKVSSEKYYANMALAWLVSVCFVKFRNKALALFEEKCLSKFVQNKSIQKCKDSFRVSKDDKLLLEKFKLK